MANRITPVKFHGATLITIDINGVAHVALRPICEAIGLNWKAQYDRIQRSPVLASSVVITTTDAQRGTHTLKSQALVLPLDKLNGWLFGVNAARVRPELREKLIQFQRECFDVLHHHFADRSKTIKPAPQPVRRIEHDTKGITPDMAAAINARAMVILSSALPNIHAWLTEQVRKGCIAPGGGPAANFENTLLHADFAAFTTHYASKHLATAEQLLAFMHKQAGEFILQVQAERARLAKESK